MTSATEEQGDGASLKNFNLERGSVFPTDAPAILTLLPEEPPLNVPCLICKMLTAAHKR